MIDTELQLLRGKPKEDKSLAPSDPELHQWSPPDQSQISREIGKMLQDLLDSLNNRGGAVALSRLSGEQLAGILLPYMLKLNSGMLDNRSVLEVTNVVPDEALMSVVLALLEQGDLDCLGEGVLMNFIRNWVQRPRPKHPSHDVEEFMSRLKRFIEEGPSDEPPQPQGVIGGEDGLHSSAAGTNGHSAETNAGPSAPNSRDGSDSTKTNHDSNHQEIPQEIEEWIKKNPLTQPIEVYGASFDPQIIEANVRRLFDWARRAKTNIGDVLLGGKSQIDHAVQILFNMITADGKTYACNPVFACQELAWALGMHEEVLALLLNAPDVGLWRQPELKKRYAQEDRDPNTMSMANVRAWWGIVAALDEHLQHFIKEATSGSPRKDGSSVVQHQIQQVFDEFNRKKNPVKIVPIPSQGFDEGGYGLGIHLDPEARRQFMESVHTLQLIEYSSRLIEECAAFPRRPRQRKEHPNEAGTDSKQHKQGSILGRFIDLLKGFTRQPTSRQKNTPAQQSSSADRGVNPSEPNVPNSTPLPSKELASANSGVDSQAGQSYTELGSLASEDVHRSDQTASSAPLNEKVEMNATKKIETMPDLPLGVKVLIAYYSDPNAGADGAIVYVYGDIVGVDRESRTWHIDLITQLWGPQNNSVDYVMGGQYELPDDRIAAFFILPSESNPETLAEFMYSL